MAAGAGARWVGVDGRVGGRLAGQAPAPGCADGPGRDLAGRGLRHGHLLVTLQVWAAEPGVAIGLHGLELLGGGAR